MMCTHTQTYTHIYLIYTFMCWCVYVRERFIKLSIHVHISDISLIFFETCQPCMEEKLKIQDTCGVHNLHGMPGILGAIVGAVTAALATEDIYGEG